MSDRQLRDVEAILEINRTRLDNSYLDQTADMVGLSELLQEVRSR